MRVVGIIQARMGSTRLPGKPLLQFGEKTLLEILVTRLRKTAHFEETIIATSNNPLDERIADNAKLLGITIFRGSENDVLDRFYRAAKGANADIIIRITADNPLTDFSLMSQQISILQNTQSDYVTAKGVILGVGSEVFTFQALKTAWQNTKKAYEREHVTPYFYNNPDMFKIKNITPPDYLQRTDIRLTIDTDKDVELFKKLYCHFEDLTNVSLREVIEFLDKNPSIKEINRNVRQKHYKEV